MTKFQTDGFKVYLAVLLFYEAKVKFVQQMQLSKDNWGGGGGRGKQMSWLGKNENPEYISRWNKPRQWFKGDDAPFHSGPTLPPWCLSKYSLNEDTRALYVG